MHLTTNPTPTLVRILWPCLLGLVLAGYFSVVYAITRGLLADFGVSPRVVVRAALPTLMMGGFVIWMVLFTEVPEMICGHVIPRRRAARDRCHACNHRIDGSSSSTCQECGANREDLPGPYAVTWRTVRRFGVILLCGLMGGVLVGELWITSDENRMRASVSHAATDSPHRDTQVLSASDVTTVLRFKRRWPADFSDVTWTVRDGFQTVQILRPRKFRDIDHDVLHAR